MTPQRLLPVLAALVAAGCVTSPAAPMQASVADDLAEAAYAYACGAGDTDACGAALLVPGKSVQEPHLAVHPLDPGVLALGVNEVQHASALRPTAEGVELSPARVAIHISEDGGASWRDADMPLLPGGPARAVISGDPALAFGRDGRLHATAMDGSTILHTWTDNLGATWSKPVPLSSNGVDRNWISILPDGRVLVVWQRPSQATEGALSADDGATWQSLAPIERCVTTSPPVTVGGIAHVACTIFEGERDVGVQLHALDADALRWSFVSETREMPVRFPHVAASGASDVAVAGYDAEDETVLLARSADGGKTWGSVVDVRSLTTLDNGWDTTRLYALHADEAGGVHVLLTGSAIGPAGLVSSRVGTAHLVLGAGNAVVLESALATRGADLPTNGSSIITASDDFGGIVDAHGETVLVWSADGAVELARVFAQPE